MPLMRHTAFSTSELISVKPVLSQTPAPARTARPQIRAIVYRTMCLFTPHHTYL